MERPLSQRVGGFADRHALALLVALGALLRLGTLPTQDFWLDEQITIDLIRQTPIDLLKGVIATESNPSLYYVLAGAWERVFGAGELGIRSFTVVVGTLVIPLVYDAARTLYSRRAGLIAAAIAATSPLLVWYAIETRSYELLVLLAALSFACFARALSEDGHRWLWCWALTAALALSTHYFAIFAIVPQAAALLLRRAGPKLDTALPMGAIVLVGLALLPITATQRGRGDWIDAYSFAGRLANVPEHFVVGYQVPWPALPAVAVIATAVAAAVAAWGGEARLRRALATAGGVAAGGFALVLLVTAVGEDYLLSRNLLELWPMFAVALAIALAAPRAGRLGIAAAACLCALGTALVVWTALTPAAQRPAYQEAAEHLGPPEPGRLIVSQSSFSSPLALYLEDGRIAGDDELTATELVVIEQRPTESYAVGDCVFLPTCGGVDVEPPPRFTPPPGFELAGREETDGFTYTTYTAPEPTPIERPVEYFTPRVFVQGPG